MLVLQGPANQPDTDASPGQALLFFKTEENAILVGTFLYMIGTLFFLWFSGSCGRDSSRPKAEATG